LLECEGELDGTTELPGALEGMLDETTGTLEGIRLDAGVELEEAMLDEEGALDGET
jgi:hypothetical protein